MFKLSPDLLRLLLDAAFNELLYGGGNSLEITNSKGNPLQGIPNLSMEDSGLMDSILLMIPPSDAEVDGEE